MPLEMMTTARPIRLLVITMLYEPDCVGIAAIASDMCNALAARGHHLTVYTTYPYYPEWRTKRNANVWKIEREVANNVQIHRHGLFIPHRPTRLLARILHELSFPLSLMRSLFRREQFDGVMVFCPLLGSVVFAVTRKLLRREPLWVNIQDLPAEAGLASGINKFRSLHRLIAFAQRSLFRRGEVWSSISPEMVDQLQPLRGKNNSLHLLPNWLVGPLQRHVRQMPSKVGRPPHRPPRLVYCGTIGNKQGLLTFCQKMKDFSQFDFRFEIFGDGSEAPDVRRWLEQEGDDRIRMGGLLPDDQFIRKIHDADWFVICEKQGAGSSFLPSKLIPCVSVGTPVLAISDRT
ncbi:MAG: glycosyltransferase, partial [Planctomycetales bacterium]|nr:glycosyltransferase [Planctomycetales bacterium]